MLKILTPWSIGTITVVPESRFIILSRRISFPLIITSHPFSAGKTKKIVSFYLEIKRRQRLNAKSKPVTIAIPAIITKITKIAKITIRAEVGVSSYVKLLKTVVFLF